jgi:hypothetical protein
MYDENILKIVNFTMYVNVSEPVQQESELFNFTIIRINTL